MAEHREAIIRQHSDKHTLWIGIQWCTDWLARNQGLTSVRTAAIHNRLQAYRLLLTR